jgi:phospholipase D1/2
MRKVTEQIYIHSKLLIVDAAVAIVGSANCNDRSLTGNGDTEIAAVIVDEKHDLEDLGDPRFKVVTRKFAQELRRRLWEKHFGFMVSDNILNAMVNCIRSADN